MIQYAFFFIFGALISQLHYRYQLADLKSKVDDNESSNFLMINHQARELSDCKDHNQRLLIVKKHIRGDKNE